ncbi:hypothetical protein MRX96_055910 [Rhipicephalus microplus]
MGSDDVEVSTCTAGEPTEAPGAFGVRHCWASSCSSGWPGALFLGVSCLSTYGTRAVFEEVDTEEPDRVWVTEPSTPLADLSSGSLVDSETFSTRGSRPNVESRRDELRELPRCGEPNRGLLRGDDALLRRCLASLAAAAASAARAAAIAMATASWSGAAGIGGGTATGALFPGACPNWTRTLTVMPLV